jgi:Tfp pilus assembly protein PilV
MSARAIRGVALIEALVALLVMAFGMVGVVGMQASLRMNADVAKQRSEAVRIAQEVIEARRAYSVMQTSAGLSAYADIVNQGAVDVVGYTTNTTYSLTLSVVDSAEPRMKTLTTGVRWDDRTGQTQSLTIVTGIAGTPPELAGTLSLPTSGLSNSPVRGRNFGVPPAAVDLGDGTSSFAPPGASGTSWIFSNVSGLITRVCVGLVCTEVTARLLSGYVHFATGPTQPTPEQGELPDSNSFAVHVQVGRTAPSALTVDCFEDTAPLRYVQYFCAVPVAAGQRWSGRATLSLLPLASSISDPSAALFRVCRYTPVRGSNPVVGPAISNQQHPLDYANVDIALTNQNFLVIRAGDGVTAFDCPADGPSTFIDSNTWHHQPVS